MKGILDVIKNIEEQKKEEERELKELGLKFKPKYSRSEIERYNKRRGRADYV